jgi:hypothetical protein
MLRNLKSGDVAIICFMASGFMEYNEVVPLLFKCEHRSPSQLLLLEWLYSLYEST